MGGVILRTEDTSLIDSFASTLGLSGKELQRKIHGGASAHRATLGEIDEFEQWRLVLSELGLPSEKFLDLIDPFYRSAKLDTDLLKFINGLRPKFKTGLLSNAWSNARNYFETYTDVLRAFDVSVFSAEIGMAKPDLAIFSHILHLLSVMPSESIFVDDNMQNVIAARDIGMNAFQFIDPQQTEHQIIDLLGIH